jgi:hypothetical protein
MARGPVHEAFATPTAEAKPTMVVNRQPPTPLDEMAPEERPEGEVVWIGGYWAWDDDRADYLWVSGCWRAKPHGKDWVAGYWREADQNQWQWVPGFWHNAQPQDAQPQAQGQAPGMVFYPEPPAAPNVAQPPKPADDTFWVPGHWQWVNNDWAWRSGFWTQVQPGFVWVPTHYRWTPKGYVFISGYWDVAVARRGMLYAPVVVDYRVVGATYVYTPAYAVSDTVVLDTMFVRPVTCHYYFGDYYEPRYRDLGYESCYVYSTRHYDSIVVYQTYEYRRDPTWISVQINLTDRRYQRVEPVPPRTLVQQTTVVNNYTVVQNNQTNIVNQTNINNTNINNTNTNRTNINNTNTNVNNTAVNNVNNTTVNNVLAPAKQVAAAKGMQTVPVDTTARVAAKQQAQQQQQASLSQRLPQEFAPKGVAPKAPTAPVVAAPLKVAPTRTMTALPSAANPQGLQAPNPGLHTNTQQQPLANTQKLPQNGQPNVGTNLNNQAGHTNGTPGVTNPNVKLGQPGVGTPGQAGVTNPNTKIGQPLVGTQQNTGGKQLLPGQPGYQPPGGTKQGTTLGPNGQPLQPGTTGAGTPPQRPVVTTQPPQRPAPPPPPAKKEEKKKNNDH